MKDPMRSRALAILREGRCTVLASDWTSPMVTAVRVIAVVRSSRDRNRLYAVDYPSGGGGWSCTCWAGQRDESCPHVLAVRYVTGHHDLAAA